MSASLPPVVPGTWSRKWSPTPANSAELPGRVRLYRTRLALPAVRALPPLGVASHKPRPTTGVSAEDDPPPVEGEGELVDFGFLPQEEVETGVKAAKANQREAAR